MVSLGGGPWFLEPAMVPKWFLEPAMVPKWFLELPMVPKWFPWSQHGFVLVFGWFLGGFLSLGKLLVQTFNDCIDSLQRGDVPCKGSQAYLVNMRHHRFRLNSESELFCDSFD